MPVHFSLSPQIFAIGKSMPLLHNASNVSKKIWTYRGLRFSYTAYRTGRSAAIKALSRTNASNITTPIHESIKDIDTQGMEIIESLDYDAFVDYLNDTENTICGRHPIGVLLCALSQLKAEGYKDQRVRFVKYAQSSACRTVRESSVSYASAFVYVNLEK